MKTNNKKELTDTEITILSYVNKALKRVYDNDYYLLNHTTNIIKEKEYNYASERSIVFRFGLYFEELIRKDQLLKGYDLDSEYNRKANNVKMLNNSSIIPDMILHKRGSNDNNLLIMEFKGHWNNNNDDIKKDYDKLRSFTSSYYEYKYRLGLFIKLKKEFDDIEIALFKKGNEYDCYKTNINDVTIKNDGINEKHILNLADEYNEACYTLYKKIEKDNDKNLILPLPITMNFALACELYLKYLCYIDDKTIPKTHDWIKLFNSLNDLHKKVLKKSIGRNDCELYSELNSGSELFEKCRYFYEPSEKTINYSFLGDFAKALYEVCHG